MSVIILDTETTGVDPAIDRLVELAAVHQNLEVAWFTTLVNPERPIPAEARAIHHIGPELLEGAPNEPTAFVRLAKHFEVRTPDVRVAVAHNAKFDRAFLRRINPALAWDWVCTYKSSMVVWPDAPNHQNNTLRYWLGLDVDVPTGLYPHRALYDCIVTRAVFLELLRHKTLAELIQISNNPVLLSKVNFGKHKGQLWANVPYGYLKWCAGQTDMDENVLHTVNYYMRNSR